ncbi:hypothetical protein Fbal_3536 [Ferrimonas balearica DSM 9799]|uniref:Uncharacterized protein n=1 Tax=Ferrimonas balearica (strain DSM 9799 / CCM 4581 / KCTC 23876 / PAT) TaxID=550540 RepID=E1SNS6_FERBD|nr:hypothetical protein [Ferrimonas balearica]MBY6019192.1 hypothetical protein [Halomonas denitrificans]ADN77733.1 hypothetical protein Fbal_3536 [Ferrimonas balearica DSM 9799]MBW3165896.1 hypothetical protein [Ferrimonas balearica]MBY5981807.1 hypothetical protein [Ferrimonas balearica]MBY6095795.1 hypothetical protein [Ferrimonas balearica]
MVLSDLITWALLGGIALMLLLEVSGLHSLRRREPQLNQRLASLEQRVAELERKQR